LAQTVDTRQPHLEPWQKSGKCKENHAKQIEYSLQTVFAAHEYNHEGMQALEYPKILRKRSKTKQIFS